MRVLFLDDMQTRHSVAKRWFGHLEYVPVYTAPEAIEALKRGPKFDLVMLDHDLAEEHYLTLSEGLSEDRAAGEAEYMCGTGMDVADFIASMPTTEYSTLEPSTVIVHSWNPGRGAEMHARLRNAGINSHKIQFDPSRCPVNINLHKEL